MHGRLGAVAHAKLLDDVHDMVLDRVRAQAEAARDLLVGQPFNDQGQHLKLAGRQPLGWCPRASCSGGDRSVREYSSTVLRSTSLTRPLPCRRPATDLPLLRLQTQEAIDEQFQPPLLQGEILIQPADLDHDGGLIRQNAEQAHAIWREARRGARWC